MLIGVAGMVGTGKTTLVARARVAVRTAARAGERGRRQSVARELLRRPGRDARVRAPSAAALSRHALCQHAPHARARRKLDSRPHLVRGRRDLRARAVRAGPDDVGGVDVVSATVLGAPAFAGRASAAAADLSPRSARRHSSSASPTRGRPKEKDASSDYWTALHAGTSSGSASSATAPCSRSTCASTIC